MNRSAESAALGAGGAALAGLVGSTFGLTVPAACIGAANGAIGGWRRVYQLKSPVGWLAFALDSTWALLTTTAAVGAHAYGAVRGDDSYSPELSERQNRHIYGKGLRIRRGFAITYGNTVCGAGDLSNPRRARLISDHENVHVWQTRWFGPLFPALYGLWMLTGGAIGGVAWVAGLRRGPLSKTIESFAYYLNPFEWWAYSRDSNWPPSGLVPGIGPRRPCVRSFSQRAVDRQASSGLRSESAQRQ